MARSREVVTKKPRRRAAAKSKPRAPQKCLRTVSPQALAMSVDQFCELHTISRDLFYQLLKMGQGPDCMLLKKRRLITFEAAAAWRAKRVAASAEAIGNETEAA